jgi:FkbM family methyltransferase
VKVLSINTYGGSLLLGASAIPSIELIGSYEDSGFGTDIQQANFPHLDFRRTRGEWPTQDLSEVFVIAHPPCSAFSVQNNNPQAKGVNSSAFACTKSVLEYSLGNGAVGLAIESVVGALAGAWQIHQKYADDFGYNLYRILQNGTMFGAQWRDRFWAVYIKKGAAPDVMPWYLMPRWSTVAQVIHNYDHGPSPLGLDVELEKLRAKFTNDAGCTPEELDIIFQNSTDGLESVDGPLARLKFPTEERWEVCKRHVTKYASSAMVILDPNSHCPVLLGSSWWFMNGRNLSESAYKRLMGFPPDYVFPEGDTRKTNYRADMRTYLSKGVMPPVAQFILENSLNHLGASKPSEQLHVEFDGAYCLEIAPDMIADFRFRKKEWGHAKPALRHEDDHGIAATVAAGVYIPKEIVEVEGTTDEQVKMVARPPKPVAPALTKKLAVPKIPRIRRQKTVWNSPELEASLAETLFVRPNTADAYALYESHGYHKMGVRSGDVLLDLGAHIGCVASRAALVGAAKIISVEAEPNNFELLQQNTRSFQNVEVIHGAVFGGSAETVKLNRVARRNDGGHSTGTHSVLYHTHGDVVEVRRVDFRQMIEEHKPTVIKCDVEGSEFSLDWTDLPEHVRAIGIELHTRRDTHREDARQIVQTLLDQGFELVNRFNIESNFSALMAYFKRKERMNENEENRPQEAVDGECKDSTGGAAAPGHLDGEGGTISNRDGDTASIRAVEGEDGDVVGSRDDGAVQDAPPRTEGQYTDVVPF